MVTYAYFRLPNALVHMTGRPHFWWLREFFHTRTGRLRHGGKEGVAWYSVGPTVRRSRRPSDQEVEGGLSAAISATAAQRQERASAASLKSRKDDGSAGQVA
jgi:hypothetical protein